MRRLVSGVSAKVSLFLVLPALLLAACGTASGPTGTPLPPSPTPSLTPTSSDTPSPLPPTLTATPAPIAGTTKAQVYVRGGPGTSYPSLGLIDPGKQVQIVGRDAAGQWYTILYPGGAGGLGWVTAAFVQLPAGATIPAPQQTDTPTPAGPAGLVQQKLNVRSGPGTSFDTLGILPAQSSVVLTGRNDSGSWLQIVYAAGPGGHGWVTAAYVQVKDASGLPVLDASGSTVTPTLQSGTPGPAVSPTPTVGPAPDDGDSAAQPGARVAFSANGTRSFSYSGEISAPAGDSQDWIAFTPFASTGSAARRSASLACSGNGAPDVELLQGGTPVPNWGTLQCGDAGTTFSLPAGQEYEFHLSLAAAAGQALSAYTLTVGNAP